jgi:membrane protein implicated in regulation of membrane protease activity
MGILESIFSTIYTWFGFVGACVVGPNATCRPFLAFLALAIASGAALLLVTRAYRALQGHDEASDEFGAERHERVRHLRAQQQVRRAVTARVAPRQVPHRSWRLPA